MWILILGLIIFLGIHCVRMVAPNWREARIAAMGEGGWKGLYSVLSLVGFGLIVWGFALARPETEFLYSLPDGTLHLAMALMLASFILLAAGNLPAGYIKKTTKHPMITAVILWAIAHLLMNGDTIALILFGVFLLWSVWNRISVAKRDPDVVANPSVLHDAIAVVAGTALWFAFVVGLHGWLFGVEVIA